MVSDTSAELGQFEYTSSARAAFNVESKSEIMIVAARIASSFGFVNGIDPEPVSESRTGRSRSERSGMKRGAHRSAPGEALLQAQTVNTSAGSPEGEPAQTPNCLGRYSRFPRDGERLSSSSCIGRPAPGWHSGQVDRLRGQFISIKTRT